MSKDNHHFVPQGYLRNFTIDGEKSLLWEYDKDTGEISHSPKSVREICSQHHYYSQEDKDGLLDKVSMEDAFHDIENKAPKIINRIDKSGAGQKVTLAAESRAILSFFTALQLSRVPNFRDGIEEMYRKLGEAELDRIVALQRKEGSCPLSIEQLYEQGKIKVEIKKFASLEPMINFAKVGCENLFKKRWTFAVPAVGMTFLTSDNPVYFQTPEQYRHHVGEFVDPLHPLSEITIPLRKDLILVISPSVDFSRPEFERIDCVEVHLDKADTKNMNKRTTLAASRYVYSSERSKALARMVGKFKGSSQRLVV